MTDDSLIVKTCKIHGPLTLAEVKVEPGVNKPYYRCRQCFQAQDLAYWRKNKEQKLVAAREYKQQNHERLSAYELSQVTELHDRYVKKLLQKSGFVGIVPGPDLIDLKRIMILIKRLIKQQQIEKKSQKVCPIITY